MQLLPHKVGPVTLMRRLGTDGITESFLGILDEPAGKTVLVRRLIPGILKHPGRVADLDARLGDLLGIRHPSLVPVLREVSAGGERLVLEDWTDALSLERIIQWCVKHKQSVPHNVFLNLAAQICNGLEALHSRPGPSSGTEAVLHLALHPGSVWVGHDGKVLVGSFGLFRSPVMNFKKDSGSGSMRLEYMAPEQTHLDQKLGPPTDVFALGALLYEILKGKPMFRAESNLQTIHRIRRAEVTTHLLEVREAFPGLDRVLYRALSLNPRHRYQRAFVLREDLRGLMAGFSFSTIAEDTRAFLAPIFMRTRGSDEPTSDTPIGIRTSEPALGRECTPLPQTDTGVLLLAGMGSGPSFGPAGTGPTLRPGTPLDAPARAAFPT
ncbi:MAG: protein kinase, partial [Deltaproteobacteria bacterium]|nr:protein kinase [Deltaproteobacteria bacterium]